MPLQQAFEVVAHWRLESGCGRLGRGFNEGGVKVSRAWAIAERARTGQPARWFRAAGHLNSGDAPCVFYRAYDSPEHFARSWLQSFVPRQSSDPGAAAHHPDYRQTGYRFWTGDPSWFAALLSEGYRGSVTQRNPEPSIAEWERLTAETQRVWSRAVSGTATTDADTLTRLARSHAPDTRALARIQPIEGTGSTHHAELGLPSALVAAGLVWWLARWFRR